MGSLDSLYRERAALWAQVYAYRETQLGNTATLINFGDQEEAGKVNATTFTGAKFNASGLSPVWTPSAALSAWSTAFNPTNPDNWLGHAPILTFNGTSEDMTTPDAAFFTRATAVASWGAWIKPTIDGVEKMILAKYNGTTGTEAREWYFFMAAAETLYLQIFDETANAWIGRLYNVALVNRWYFAVATYSGGTTNAAIKIYLDGVQVDDSDAGSGVFSTMQDTVTLPRVGSYLSTGGTSTSFWDGGILGGPFCPFFVQAELTVAQIKNLYRNERHLLGV